VNIQTDTVAEQEANIVSSMPAVSGMAEHTVYLRIRGRRIASQYGIIAEYHKVSQYESLIAGITATQWVSAIFVTGGLSCYQEDSLQVTLDGPVSLES
jgi:hypothetical protein